MRSISPRELASDVRELAERAGDRAQRDAFQRLAEIGHGRVEALPELRRAAPRPGAGAQLVGELHVPGARMRTVGEAELIGVTQRGRLLLGGVGDRPHALREPEIRRRLDARLERVAPALVGELHLFDRDPRIPAHRLPCPLPGPTAMMWSAICRGAGVRRCDDARGRASDSASCAAYAGDASDISARSTSERRTRHSGPRARRRGARS